MAFGSVQFRSKEHTLQAFINRGVEPWSVWQGKQYMFKGMGSDQFSEVLDMLCESGSTNAIYTVKVYENIHDSLDIKNNTPDDGSFNFRLNGGEQEISNDQYYTRRIGASNEIIKRLEQIEQKLSADEEDEPDTIGSIFLEHLKDPEKLGRLIQMTREILSPYQPGMVGNVYRTIPATNQSAMGNDQTSEQKLERLSAAIDVLEKHDSHLVDHLEKLAKVAINNPPSFKVMLSMLDNL